MGEKLVTNTGNIRIEPDTIGGKNTVTYSRPYYSNIRHDNLYKKI